MRTRVDVDRMRRYTARNRLSSQRCGAQFSPGTGRPTEVCTLWSHDGPHDWPSADEASASPFALVASDFRILGETLRQHPLFRTP